MLLLCQTSLPFSNLALLPEMGEIISLFTSKLNSPHSSNPRWLAAQTSPSNHVILLRQTINPVTIHKRVTYPINSAISGAPPLNLTLRSESQLSISRQQPRPNLSDNSSSFRLLNLATWWSSRFNPPQPPPALLTEDSTAAACSAQMVAVLSRPTKCGASIT